MNEEEGRFLLRKVDLVLRSILMATILILSSHAHAELSKMEPSEIQSSDPQIKTRNRRLPGVWGCQNCLWLGGGAHYLVFQQKPPKDVDPVNYQSIGAPSLAGELRFKLFRGLGLTGEYHSQSGADLKTTTLNLQETKIRWTYSSLGLDYRFKGYFRLFGKIWRPRLLFAYQKHQMPYLQKMKDEIYNVTPLLFNSLSLGGYFDILSSEQWHFFLTNRLQVPLQSESKILIQQGFSFDGALGAVYHWNARLAWAFYWGGQSHQLKYKDELEEGTYTLWTSKVNTLLGFYF